MKNSTNCGQCDSPIPADAPGGICPQCLLGLGMLPDAYRPTSAMPEGSHSESFSVPGAEQLLNRFPDLEILHLIGQGGMGAVYQARQKNLDRLVALKILSPRLENDPTFTERFMREAKTLAKLSHPNIVTVYNFGQAEEMYFLVMEYVDGVNLRDTIQAKTLDPQKAMVIIPQICDALQYAHDKGVVHRDIKPENILVNTDGDVKIADFGLAKLLDPSAQDFALTSTRQVMGTLKYMSPEQIEKPETVDHRADLYSLGVVFYELLTGELPIGRFSLPSEKADVNQQLDKVVLKTLEKEPDQRYQQASHIKTAVSDAQAAVVAGRESLSAESTKMPTVPFRSDTTWDFVYGFAAVNDANNLELEYEVRNGVTFQQSEVQKIVVPLKKIVRVDFQRGFFADFIEIQADSIEAFKDLKFAKHGLAKLKFKKADSDRAFQFATHLQSLIAGNGAKNNPPTAPIKSHHIDLPNNLATGLRRNFILTGLFLFIASMLLMLLLIPYSFGTSEVVLSQPETPLTVTEETASRIDVVQDSPSTVEQQAVAGELPSLDYRLDLSAFVLIGLVAMVAFAIIVVLTIWLVISARNRAKDEF